MAAGATSQSSAISNGMPLDTIGKGQSLNTMENGSGGEVDATKGKLDALHRKRRADDSEVPEVTHSKRAKMEKVAREERKTSEPANTRVLRSSTLPSLSVNSSKT